jgi:hypothetical protein
MDFTLLNESCLVTDILIYDYNALNNYAGGYGWKILKMHAYGTPIVDKYSKYSNIYDKIRDHMHNLHTDKSFEWSMNIMEFIAKIGFSELISYTKMYPEWYITK